MEAAIAVSRRSWAWLEARGLTREALRDGILIWAGQRALVVALVALWQALAHVAYGAGTALTWRGLFRPLVAYDGARYAAIAGAGYDRLPQAAFFPLYPLLERIIAPLTGGDARLAGLLLANGAALAGFVLLRVLVERDVDPAVARRTLILLAVFPTSMFFLAAYTESLFLLFSVAAFLAIRGRRWALAGALITLATLARSAGVLLLLPLALEAVACYGLGVRALRAAGRNCGVLALALALPLLTLLAWRLYLDRHFGVSNALGAAIGSSDWGRALSWPWYGVLEALRAEMSGGPLWMVTKATRDLLFTVAWLGCTAAMVVRRAALPRGYVAYAVGSLALALVFPIHARPYDALNSLDRYLLVVFPCFVLAAQWSIESAAAWRALRIALPLALVIMASFFALGGFIG